MSDAQTELAEQVEAQRKLLPLPPIAARRVAAVLRQTEAIRSRLATLEVILSEMAAELKDAEPQSQGVVLGDDKQVTHSDAG